MPIADNIFWTIDIVAGTVFAVASLMFWLTKTSVENGREIPGQGGLVGTSDQDRQTVANERTV
jgi:hypothetical protein